MEVLIKFSIKTLYQIPLKNKMSRIHLKNLVLQSKASMVFKTQCLDSIERFQATLLNNRINLTLIERRVNKVYTKQWEEAISWHRIKYTTTSDL